MRVFVLLLLVGSAPLGAQETLVRPPSAAEFTPYGLNDRWDYVIDEVAEFPEHGSRWEQRFGIQSLRVVDVDTHHGRTQYWLYAVLKDSRGRVMRAEVCRVRMNVETLSSTYWDRWEAAVREDQSSPSEPAGALAREPREDGRDGPGPRSADSAILMAPQEIVSLQIDQLGCNSFEGLVFSDPVSESRQHVQVGEDRYETAYFGRSEMVLDLGSSTTTESWSFASGLGIFQRVERSEDERGGTLQLTHRLVYARVGDLELGEPLDIDMSYVFGQTGNEVLASAPSAAHPEKELAIVSAGPNPFRDRLWVSVHVPQPGPVWIDVVDLLGRRITRTSLGEQSAGALEHEISGAGMAPGVYFVRVEAGESLATRQVTLVR